MSTVTYYEFLHFYGTLFNYFYSIVGVAAHWLQASLYMYSRTCTMDIIMQQRSQFLLPYCDLAFFLFAVKTSRMTIKSTVIVFIVGFLCYSLLNMMRVVVLFSL